MAQVLVFGYRNTRYSIERDESDVPDILVVNTANGQVQRKDPTPNQLKDFLTRPERSKGKDNLHVVYSNNVTPKDIANYINAPLSEINARMINIDDLYKASKQPYLNQSKTGEKLDAEGSTALRRIGLSQMINMQMMHNINVANEYQKTHPEKAPHIEKVTNIYKKIIEKNENNLNRYKKSKQGEALAPGVLVAETYLDIYKKFKSNSAAGSERGEDAFNRACVLSDQMARMWYEEKPLLEFDDKKAFELKNTLRENTENSYFKFVDSLTAYEDSLINKVTLNTNPQIKKQYAESSAKLSLLSNITNIDLPGALQPVTDPERFKQIINYPACHVDHEPLVNPRWFANLEGDVGDINELAKKKSIEYKHVLGLDPEKVAEYMGDPMEAKRLALVQSLCQLRSDADAYIRTSKYLEKISALQEDYGYLPIDISPNSAQTGRHRAGNKTDINFQGLTQSVKDCIKPVGDKIGFSQDMKQAEPMAASYVYSLSSLKNAFDLKLDPYAFGGASLMAAQERQQKNTHWDENHVTKVAKDIMTASKAKPGDILNLEVMSPDKVDYLQEYRSLGKTLTIATIYGKGGKAVALENGWRPERGENFMNMFKGQFPELKTVIDKMDNFLKDGMRKGHSELTIGTETNPVKMSISSPQSQMLYNIYQGISNQLDPDAKEVLNATFVAPLTHPPLDLKIEFANGDFVSYTDLQLESKNGRNWQTPPDQLINQFCQNSYDVNLTYAKADGERRVLYPAKLGQNTIQAMAASLASDYHVETVRAFEQNDIAAKVTLPIHDALTVIADSDKDMQNAKELIPVVSEFLLQKGHDFSPKWDVEDIQLEQPLYTNQSEVTYDQEFEKISNEFVMDFDTTEFEESFASQLQLDDMDTTFVLDDGFSRESDNQGVDIHELLDKKNDPIPRSSSYDDGPSLS